jgi:hypothetical protein
MPAMTSIGTTQTSSQISPANERVYHQSNLLGDWKGSFTKNHQPIELKVVSINGQSAQVEYTHNGRTERGTGTVDGSTVSFGNITIGTRNGTTAALEFSYGTTKMTAVLSKAATPADQNKLVGDWIGSSATQSATFKVASINGRDAQVQYTIGGQTGTGIGDLYKNTVTLGRVQVSSADGVQGTITFPVGHSTLTLHVTKFTPNTSSSSANGAGSSVNKLA